MAPLACVPDQAVPEVQSATWRKRIGAGKVLRGAKQVHIMEYLFDVNAEVHSIHSLSAHGDRKEIMRFLSCQNKDIVKAIFLVHGEADAKEAMANSLMKEGYKKVFIPRKHETISLA